MRKHTKKLAALLVLVSLFSVVNSAHAGILDTVRGWFSDELVRSFGSTYAFPVDGGTGTSTSPGENSILIGNSEGVYDVKTLTAGSNVAITNSGSTVTIASTGGGGSAGAFSSTSPWTANQLVQVVDNDTFTSIATSSLGLLTTHVSEGSNLYFTDARVNSYIHGSTTIPKTYTSNTWGSTQTFTNQITGSISGTASALAANGGNCSAGSFPLGVDASGAVESCTDAWTEAENTAAGYLSAAVTAIGPAGQTSDGPTVTVATSSDTNIGLTITGSGDTLTFTSNWIGTLANSRLTNSTISGIALGSNLANLSATDSTLTFSGTYNGGTARTIGLNLGNANTWTALQTFGNSSTTAASFGYASSTLFYGAGLQTCDATTGKLTWSNGVFGCGTDFNTGGSGASDFTFETTYNQLTAATSSRVWFKNPIYASSTLQFNTNLISEHASLRFLDIQGRAGGDYTLARIKAPRTTPYEATLALLLDESGDNSGTNESFFDLYNEGYGDSYQAGFRLVDTGTARPKPIVLGHYNDDGLSKDNGNKLVLFPSGTAWFGQGTSSASLSSQVHIASSTATTLLRVDAAPGTNRLLLTNAGLLGIASSSPLSKLTLQGTAGTGLVNFASSTGASIFSINSLDQITLGGGTGNIFFDTNSSVKVGLGTTSPYMTLSVAGGAHIGGDLTATGTTDFTASTVKIKQYPSLSYATSTAWTGTTTIPLGPAFVAETWNSVKCFTDTGTLNVSFYDGTNRMNMFNASTTVGTVTLSTNNTFTASEKRYVDVGTPASTPTKISCTVDKTINQ
jgi:hypothetical protein